MNIKAISNQKILLENLSNNFAQDQIKQLEIKISTYEGVSLNKQTVITSSGEEVTKSLEVSHCGKLEESEFSLESLKKLIDTSSDEMQQVKAILQSIVDSEYVEILNCTYKTAEFCEYVELHMVDFFRYARVLRAYFDDGVKRQIKEYLPEDIELFQDTFRTSIMTYSKSHMPLSELFTNPKESRYY